MNRTWPADSLYPRTHAQLRGMPLATKTYLRVVPEPPEGQALILQFTHSPQLKGKDVDANIACSACKKLLAGDMTTQSLSESLSA